MSGAARGRAGGAASAFNRRLRRVYGWYTLGFAAFVAALAVLEQVGMSRAAMGYTFLGATIMLYASIGVMSRTSDANEYYVAGRRVPAMFNGMASGADWMSGASFVAMAGGLYLQGYSGLAFIMGWTGGFVLVALLLAPYLRKFGQYTIPDFLGARYGSHVPRLIGIAIAILCSFTYVVAQIQAVGIITSRFTGVEFSIGVFLGLAGVLVCSFLGGMRAVTWTQVAQYIVLIIAYLIPVVWLAAKQTGVPVPQLVYGVQLAKVTQLEETLIADPGEREVRRILVQRAGEAAERLRDAEAAFAAGRAKLETELALARKAHDRPRTQAAARAMADYPKSAAEARARWEHEVQQAERNATLRRHAEPYPGRDEREREFSRRNFLALIFCLTVGTAGLPHILMRYYTTPSVREARTSVAWSLLFIFLLYVTAPALAVLVKYSMYHDVVGTAFADLPGWVRSWQAVDPRLLALTDVNGDGIVQRAEISLHPDIVVLATPEIAGLPYVISGLVAAGGMAAALSTADGLLLTIVNALSHDLYYKMIDPSVTTGRRVVMSKMLLLVVAVLAALVATQRPGDILFLVSAAFSFAAAGFFPALVLGIFWKRTTGAAAAAGMLAGFGVTFYYMTITEPWLRSVVHGVETSVPVTGLWWGIEPISAGLFGVPVGFVVIVLLSLVTRPPSAQMQEMVEQLRYPNLRPADGGPAARRA